MFGNQDIGTYNTIDPRHLLRGLFFRLLYAPLVSATDSQKWSCDDKHLQATVCGTAQSGQFEANLIHAMDFASVKLFSVTYPEFYLAKKCGTQRTCKQTVKHSSHNHGIRHHMNTFLNLWNLNLLHCFHV